MPGNNLIPSRSFKHTAILGQIVVCRKPHPLFPFSAQQYRELLVVDILGIAVRMPVTHPCADSALTWTAAHTPIYSGILSLKSPAQRNHRRFLHSKNKLTVMDA